jgi:hypothetical protein
VADWETHDVVAMLKTGVSARGAVLGPMSEVVLNSTQYLSGGRPGGNDRLPEGRSR